MDLIAPNPLNRQFEAKTLLVILLCSGLAAFGGYRLYSDLDSGGLVHHGKTMARVERREARVRYKTPASFVWETVEQDQSLYEHESVQTGHASAAVIRMSGGATLELGENSLIVLNEVDNLALNFVKGSAVVHESSGDRQISMSKDGKVSVEKLNIRLLNPGPLAEYFVSGGEAKSIQFEWDKPGEFFVEVSRDRTFSAARTDRIPADAGKKTFAAKSLAVGNYYWRVTGADGTHSQVRVFRVSTASPLQLLSPSAMERVRAFGDVADLQFRWMPSQTSLATNPDVRHQLEISADPAFKKVEETQDVFPNSGNAIVRTAASGSLFWRIRSHYGDLVLSSPVEKFTLERTDKVLLELLRPAENDQLALGAPVRFTWNANAGDLEYAWEIQDSKGTRLATSKGPVPGTLWKDTGPGAYRWRVVASWNGKSVGESSWRPFSISSGSPLVLLTPAKDEKFVFWEKELPLSFRWQKDALLERPEYSYVIEVAADREFKGTLLTKTSRAPQLAEATIPPSAIPDEPRAFFWKVKVTDSSGKIVKTSEPLSFFYGRYPRLAAPQSVMPAAIFNLRDDKKVPLIEWAAVEGAKGYEVSVFRIEPKNNGRGPAAEQVIVKQLVPDAKFEFSKLPVGKYHWNVRALDRIDRPGQPSARGEFEVSYGKPLRAPKVRSAEVQ